MNVEGGPTKLTRIELAVQQLGNGAPEYEISPWRGGLAGQAASCDMCWNPVQSGARITADSNTIAVLCGACYLDFSAEVALVQRENRQSKALPASRARWHIPRSWATLAIYRSPAIWLGAALLASFLLWRFQIADRGPLVWDEAVRVDAGSNLAYAVTTGNLHGVWQWINAQAFYPFLGPALNGLVLLLTGNGVAAAWVPSLFAYGLAGLLAARLAFELGAAAFGAWSAALLTWFAPIEARDASGAFTEPVGACFVLALLIVLVRLERMGGVRRAFSAGLIAALCWFLKYDYGLLAMATIGLTGLVVALSSLNRTEAIRRYGSAIAAGTLPILAWFLVDPVTKLSGALSVVTATHGPNGPSGGSDFGYYPSALFDNGEVGLSLFVAAILALGLIAALIQYRRRALWAPLISLALWYVIYSSASVQYSRYLGLILPVLAVLAGLAIQQLAEHAQFAKPEQRRPTSLAAGAAAAVILLLQASASSTGLGVQFWFIQPDHPAAGAADFASNELNPSAGSVLMLDQTNEFSPFALHLAWTERLAKPAPPVYGLGDSGPQPTRESLLSMLRNTGAGQLVGVEIGAGSQLDTSGNRTQFANGPAYVTLARGLESEGLLTRVAATSLESGHLGVIVWRYTG